MIKRILLAIIPAVVGVMCTLPVQATNGISAVVVPNPFGIPEVILVVSFLGIAAWKRTWIRVILSLGVIILGAFSISYDIRIGATLVSIGSILFIMGILNLIKQYRGGE